MVRRHGAAAASGKPGDLRRRASCHIVRSSLKRRPQATTMMRRNSRCLRIGCSQGIGGVRYPPHRSDARQMTLSGVSVLRASRSATQGHATRFRPLGSGLTASSCTGVRWRGPGSLTGRSAWSAAPPLRSAAISATRRRT